MKKAFSHIVAKEKLAFAINVCLSGVISMIVRFLSYKNVAKHFGHPCKILEASTVAPANQIQKARFISQSITRAARCTPWKSTCLTQALIAKFWCQLYRIPYLLFIGVEKKPTALSSREAHAWVTVGPVSVTGGGQQCFNTHHVISSYSNVI